MLVLGIDIGTTTVSFSVIDKSSKQTVCAFNKLNDSAESGENFTQNAERIYDIVENSLEDVFAKHKDLTAIGITGQMHGIVYVDDKGQAVSPLYTWQNRFGNIDVNGKTYCQIIQDLSGYKISSGYGLCTHFYAMKNGLVPKDAVKICTIMDYVGMRLTGRKTPLIHTSNAASLGMFDVKNKCFDQKAITALDINQSILPCVTDQITKLGEYKNAQVYCAIGDNQASFLGATAGENNCALVNYGTGSQISILSDYVIPPKGMELRPYLFGKYLLCGSALCGGKAYALTEKFFRSYLLSCGIDAKSQYDVLNVLAQKAFENDCSPTVVTTFSGTREDASEYGKIFNLTENNFMPEQIVLGVLKGMVKELKDFYDLAGKNDVTNLVASGNAVRKNQVLQKLLLREFSLPMTISENQEEAAFGSALLLTI